jgi:hypothetical protein
MTEQDVFEPEPEARSESRERMRSASEQASSVVRQAADILESELSGGIEEARRLQQRFTEQRRLEPGDLDELASRVRRSAHDLIDVLTDRFHDLGAQDVQDLANRFSKDAHSALDGVMDLVDAAPEVVNRLIDRPRRGPRDRSPAGAPGDVPGTPGAGGNVDDAGTEPSEL